MNGGERVAAVEKIKDSASPLIFSGTAIGKFAKVTSVWAGVGVRKSARHHDAPLALLNFPAST
jgi:hypothetical protein